MRMHRVEIVFFYQPCDGVIFKGLDTYTGKPYYFK